MARVRTDLVSCRGSALKGALKTIGFFLVIGAAIPLHFLFRASRRFDPTVFPRVFHGVMARMLGLKLRVHGQRSELVPTLFVSNHSSYLDIIVLGAVIPGCFVAKSEVASWPLIGFMAKLQKTVFVERRSVRAALQNDVLRERLEKGDSLILFPEGTSSDGHRTLPFKSSLFAFIEKPLEDNQYATVQPVSVVATEIGGLPMGRAWRPYYAWYGDMTLVKHMWEFFKIGSFTVDIIFHPPVTMEDFDNRKLLAEYCQRAVTKGVDQCVTGRFL